MTLGELNAFLGAIDQNCPVPVERRELAVETLKVFADDCFNSDAALDEWQEPTRLGHAALALAEALEAIPATDAFWRQGAGSVGQQANQLNIPRP